MFMCTDHDIVASFNVEKSSPFLEDNILQLEDDIFDEISFPSIKVSLFFLFYLYIYINKNQITHFVVSLL